MKHIGHVDGATNSMPSTWKTHSLGMLAPHDLFIPNPGERENVDTDRWQHVGWINSDKDGGAIFTAYTEAAEHGEARPAYIPSDKPVPVFQGNYNHEMEAVKVVHNIGGKTDPMDVRRSEFEALRKDLQTLEVKFQTLARIQQHGQLAPSEPPMTFYDHAFIACASAGMAINGLTKEKAIRAAKELARFITENRTT